MRIKEKIYIERPELDKEGPITIVAFGDSVTHGALGHNEINYETVYWNLLRKKILSIRDFVPVNVINAGIGGTTAYSSMQRVDKQVLAHSPDLIIICFGLNDVNEPSLDGFLSPLKTIFEKCVSSGAEVIFMTPNMLNTYVSPDTAPEFLDYAAVTAEYQNGGKMDLYMEAAVKLAEEMGITVCDCYSEWKKLSATQDTTKLLANYINHPTKEMHELFANMLFDIIFKDATDKNPKNESTMYNKQLLDN